MTDTGFQKLGHSQRRLYGPRKVLLCGFSPPDQSKFKTMLGMLDMCDLPLVWAGAEDGQVWVGQLMQRAVDSGEGAPSPFPRAIIVAGIEERALHQLMAGCRQAGMRQALWATLTPTSEQWPLQRLLDELTAERAAFSQK